MRNAKDRTAARTGTLKACSRCRRLLPLAMFGLDRRVKGGRKARCADCCAWACRQTYAGDRENRAAAERDRPKDPAARRATAYRAAAKKPIARRAREIIALMVRNKEIPRAAELPCADCGEPANAYDHPRGYDGENARLVEPVCHTCHGGRSRQRREHVRRPDPLEAAR